MKLIFQILLCLGLLCMYVEESQGFFQDATDGARPAGMGEAFVAVADDTNAVLFNPAGYARIPCLEVSGMYSDLYTGLNPVLYNGDHDRLGYSFVSLALPVSKSIGNFGASWIQLQSDFYQENTLALSYARRIWERFNLDLGANVKILSWKIPGNDFTNGESRSRATVDVGALGTLIENLQAGIGFDNIIPADMGLDETELAPCNVRIGMAYLFPAHAGALETVQAQLELDYRTVAYERGESNLKFGLEARLFKQCLALRAGVNRDVVTCGLGMQYPLPGQSSTLQLDYAFAFPLELKYNNGSHRIGLTVRNNCLRPAETPTAQPTVQATPMPESTPAPTPTPEAARELEQKLQELQKKIEVGELRPIYFDLNKDTIKPESFATLDYLGGILETYSTLRVQISGHTDSQGEAEYNKQLSQARVESAQKYLVDKFKISPSNLVPVGYGEEKPIADNSTKEGRAKNRRVEFHVISQNETAAKIEISPDSRTLTIETLSEAAGTTPAANNPLTSPQQ